MITYRTIAIDGLDIFYREAGSRDNPTILLLHGFPTSSHMFRNLIPALADRFHLVAPDYPGYGNSSMPTVDEFDYTFDRLAEIVEKFVAAIDLKKYSLYVMDYGAPIGYRIAAKYPERVQALIVQNGNAYEEGLREFWNPIKAYWHDRSPENADKLRHLFTLEATKWQYTNGVRNLEAISPDTWTVDQHFLDRPGNSDIQLALKYDYQYNVLLYPQWQAYLRQYQPPTLVVWGKNDQGFSVEGAHAYKRDLQNLEFHLFDTGHFALEEDGEAIADHIRCFLTTHVVENTMIDMTTTTDPDFAAREALRLLGPDPENWVPDRPGVDHNVTIIGGSGSGSTFVFALRRAGIGRVTEIDAADDEAHAGVWLTRARMKTLRTPKNLPGPELGIPELSFQAWYEARHGAAAYAQIDRIGRVAWAEYLSWYRQFLGIQVRYRTKLVRIQPDAGFFRLHLEVNGVPQVETTRKIIFANGVAGTGGPYIPPALADLPHTLYAHTADAIDFEALRGKTVAVLGAAASAFDAAGVALESGAKAVHLFVRRSELASLSLMRVRDYPGAYDNYPQLPDAVRWFQAWRFHQAGTAPPPNSIKRAIAFPNFHIHLSAPWKSARKMGDRIVIQVNDDVFEFDFAIAGTGYFVDPTKRPELADFAQHIALWRDRYEPPEDLRDDNLGMHPYLGSGHEYQEKVPGTAPYLKDIHVFNPAGLVSFGLPVGDIPSIRRDVPAIVSRISHDLFFEDWAHHEARITGDIAPDFENSLYAAAVWKQPLKAATR